MRMAKKMAHDILPSTHDVELIPLVGDKQRQKDKKTEDIRSLPILSMQTHTRTRIAGRARERIAQIS
jgi:hypothetical protein